MTRNTTHLVQQQHLPRRHQALHDLDSAPLSIADFVHSPLQIDAVGKGRVHPQSVPAAAESGQNVVEPTHSKRSKSRSRRSYEAGKRQGKHDQHPVGL